MLLFYSLTTFNLWVIREVKVNKYNFQIFVSGKKKLGGGIASYIEYTNKYYH